MKLFSLDFGFGSVLLLIVLALLGIFGATGCQSSGDQLRQDAATWISVAKQSGFRAEADVYLSPDGGVWFGPALGVQNRSYVIVHLRADATGNVPAGGDGLMPTPIGGQ